MDPPKLGVSPQAIFVPPPLLCMLQMRCALCRNHPVCKPEMHAALRVARFALRILPTSASPPGETVSVGIGDAADHSKLARGTVRQASVSHVGSPRPGTTGFQTTWSQHKTLIDGRRSSGPERRAQRTMTKRPPRKPPPRFLCGKHSPVPSAPELQAFKSLPTEGTYCLLR